MVMAGMLPLMQSQANSWDAVMAYRHKGELGMFNVGEVIARIKQTDDLRSKIGRLQKNITIITFALFVDCVKFTLA